MKENSDKANEVMEELRSVGSDGSSADGGDDDDISKEEVAKEFDGVFVKTRAGEVQHLAHENPDKTLCGKDLSEYEHTVSDDYGPFNPICKECAQDIGVHDIGAGVTTKTKMDLKEELINEVPGVDDDTSHHIRKGETKIILDYIRELKEQN